MEVVSIVLIVSSLRLMFIETIIISYAYKLIF